MPIYTCPDCGAKLKKNNPLEPGKKLKCSECETIFVIKGEKPKPKAAPPPKIGRFAGEEDGPDDYQLIEDVEDKGAAEERAAAFDPLKERFEKSKRGPALGLVIRPSNVLLLSGVLTCLLAVGGAFTSVFQLIFKVEDVTQKASLYSKPGDNKKRYIELSDDEKTARYWALAGCVGFFLWGSVVCAGASKMHEIDVYWLAMTGAIMAIVGPLVPVGVWLYMEGTSSGETDMAFVGPAILCFASGLPPSAWAISTLRNPKVLEGYNEEAVE